MNEYLKEQGQKEVKYKEPDPGIKQLAQGTCLF
jgi:hypothetical protein